VSAHAIVAHAPDHIRVFIRASFCEFMAVSGCNVKATGTAERASAAFLQRAQEDRWLPSCLRMKSVENHADERDRYRRARVRCACVELLSITTRREPEVTLFESPSSLTSPELRSARRPNRTNLIGLQPDIAIRDGAGVSRKEKRPGPKGHRPSHRAYCARSGLSQNDFVCIAVEWIVIRARLFNLDARVIRPVARSS